MQNKNFNSINLETPKKIKDDFNSLLKNRKIKTKLKISLGLIVISWILIGIFYKNFPPEIPVFFSKPWGLEQLAEKWFLFVLAATLTITYAMNIRFASMAVAKDKLLANIFLVSQLFFSILVFLIILRLIFLIA